MKFTSLYSNVAKYGLRGDSRAGETKQILNEVCEAEVGTFPCRPGGAVSVGLIEGVQMIAGTAEMLPIRTFAPGAKHELFGLSSFYGPRIASQVPRVLQELRQHPNTRRAILYVGGGADSPDTVPCTNTIQFQSQYPGSVYLSTIVSMRSSDLVYGLPYDIIQFSMLAYAVASCCDMIARDVVVHSSNAHIYTATAVAPEVWEEGTFVMPHIGTEWSDWVQWGRDIVYMNPAQTRSNFLNLFHVKLPAPPANVNRETSFTDLGK